MTTPTPANTQEFEYVRVLKTLDRSNDTFREDGRAVLKKSIQTTDQAISTMLKPILEAFGNTHVPLIKISIKAAGPFPHAQFLTELDLDFQVAKVEFHIKTLNVPCSLALIYRKLKDLCSLKFLHLRYVSLTEDDEQVLKEIIEEQKLIVLFLGVVSMRGHELMQALEKSTSIQTVALIWLHLHPTGHDFPVKNFCERLHTFSSIHNLVLLPFASDPELWTALNSGLRQSTTLQDIMVSGDGGCVLQDDIVAGLANNLNRMVTKKLRLNNATLGPRGMETLCQLLLNSRVEFLDLSGSALAHESVVVFANYLPRMKNLKVIDFKEIKDSKGNLWSTETLNTMHVGLEQNEHLEEASLSYSPKTIHLQRSCNFYMQRNRTRQMMVEGNLSVWPEALSRIGIKTDPQSLTFHLLRERVDILFDANGYRKKRAATNPTDEQRATKRAKRENTIEPSEATGIASL